MNQLVTFLVSLHQTVAQRWWHDCFKARMFLWTLESQSPLLELDDICTCGTCLLLDIYFCRIIQNWYWPLNHLVMGLLRPLSLTHHGRSGYSYNTLPQVVTWFFHAVCIIKVSLAWQHPFLHRDLANAVVDYIPISELHVISTEFQFPVSKGNDLKCWNLSLQLANFQEFGIVLAMFRLGWFPSDKVLWENIWHWWDVAHVCLFLQ